MKADTAAPEAPAATISAAAIVHACHACVDSLLADFAFGLEKRGAGSASCSVDPGGGVGTREKR